MNTPTPAPVPAHGHATPAPTEIRAFPLATWAQARRDIVRQLRRVPGARSQAAAAALLLAVGAWSTVSVPRLLGRIVDIVTSSGEDADLWRTAGLMVLAAVVAGTTDGAGYFLLARLSERLIANLREEMVGTALGLPMHRVEDAGTGDVVSRSTDDVAQVSSAVMDVLPVLSGAVFVIAATGVGLLTVDWRFLAVIVLVAPVYWFAARAYLRQAPQLFADERASMGLRARRVLEAIHGRRTVRAFRAEAEMHRRIGEASWSVVTNAVAANRVMVRLLNRMLIAELVMISTSVVLGFVLVDRGLLGVGAVTGATLMVIRVRGPLQQVMRVLDAAQSGYASLARIIGVTVDPPVPVPDSGAPEPVGDVVLDGVTFSYAEQPGDTSWAVEDVSFRIAPGRTVALVGSSGAGKTTVATLLAGLRRPTSGSVTVDGVPVTALSDAERSSRLALVSQEVHVFSGPLRDDLLLAAPDAGDDRLRAALAAVGADTWLDRLPDGLDTEVGSRGLMPDPVVAQQLALARVLLRDPRVVVLDEATAEAGSAGAQVLEDAARRLTRDRTALTVAHRLDSARHADEVLVMEEGRIVERGTHAELVAQGGVYAGLWEVWSRGR